MTYVTLEVEIEHGKVLPKEPGKLPETGGGLPLVPPGLVLA